MSDMQLVEFRNWMTCPACNFSLWWKNHRDNNEYHDGSEPRYCHGQKGIFTKCKRLYPHLHWKCKVCKCQFVSETKIGQDQMKQVRS